MFRVVMWCIVFFYVKHLSKDSEERSKQGMGAKQVMAPIFKETMFQCPEINVDIIAG